MCAGWSHLAGDFMSRSASPSASKPMPICHCQAARSGSAALPMSTPKMSEYDSFSAPDCAAYSRRAVRSVTPWNISWPTMSSIAAIDSGVRPPSRTRCP